MGLDISSKRGLSFSCGYASFLFMRNSIMESLVPGFGVLHWWAVHCSCLNVIPFVKERGWDNETNRMEYEISTVTKATPAEFGKCCNEILYAWCRINKMTALWDLLICHSDCGGTLTGSQCRRLIKDLDRISLPKDHSSNNCYEEFKELVRRAAEKNDTLFFS